MLANSVNTVCRAKSFIFKTSIKVSVIKEKMEHLHLLKENIIVDYLKSKLYKHNFNFTDYLGYICTCNSAKNTTKTILYR